MITEQELKDQCTSDIIKKMCELAEGFEYMSIGNWSGYRFELHKPNDNDPNVYYPLLIHRAIEGWNGQSLSNMKRVVIYDEYIEVESIVGSNIKYWLKNYQSENLTQLECALLHCLIEIFKEK